MVGLVNLLRYLVQFLESVTYDEDPQSFARNVRNLYPGGSRKSSLSGREVVLSRYRDVVVSFVDFYRINCTTGTVAPKRFETCRAGKKRILEQPATTIW